MLNEDIHSEEPVAGNLHGGFCGGQKREISSSTRHTIDHELLMKAVKRYTEEKWVLIYIERWLKAGILREDCR
jgi:hypothetical protein